MFGLFDDKPSGSLFEGGGYNAPPGAGFNMMSPQDRFMALMSGLSSAGTKMAQSNQGGWKGLAMGLGGLGEGIAKGGQQALMQRLLGQRYEDAQAKAAREKKQREDQEAYIATLPPEMQAMARTNPGKFFETKIDRSIQKLPDLPKLGDVRKFFKNGKEIAEQFDGKDWVGLGEDSRYEWQSPGYVGSRAAVAGAEANARVPAAVRQAAALAPIEVAREEAKPYTLGNTRYGGAPLPPNLGGGIPAGVPRIGQPRPAPMPQVNPQAAGQPAPMPIPQAGGTPAPMPQASPPAQQPGQPRVIASNPDTPGEERKWRQDFDKLVNSATELVKQRDRVRTSLARNDGTGDIAAIIGFNKMLDEGAIVREQDVSLTRSAVGLADQLKAWMDNKAEGDILPPALRAKIGELSEQIAQVSSDATRARVMPYQPVIEKQGLSFDNVLPKETRNMLGWSGVATAKITDDAAGEAAFNALPSGAQFYDPTGTLRRKP